MSSRMPPIGIRSSRAPRASNLWNAPCRAGRSGAGLMSRRSRREKAMNRYERSGQQLSIRLPRADRTLETFELAAPRTFPQRTIAKLNRIAFSAAHVVADPLADIDPWLATAIDWERTIAF